MTSDRPYRKALSHADALQEIISCSGTQFDPALVQKFVALYPTSDLHAKTEKNGKDGAG
jgi:HD-GYP domain-containing protein (c-di-GMP phosphodiesterase class II)